LIANACSKIPNDDRTGISRRNVKASLAIGAAGGCQAGWVTPGGAVNNFEIRDQCCRLLQIGRLRVSGLGIPNTTGNAPVWKFRVGILMQRAGGTIGLTLNCTSLWLTATSW